jgi:hypothetical protein
MSQSIKIFEPIYAAEQILSDRSFHPLVLQDNSHAAWREFHILVHMYRNGVHREQKFTGLFSPKFSLKARISGARFLEFAQSNANADVCFINPFPQLAYFSFNSWMQGEHAHPGLIQRSQLLLDACGIKWSIRDTPRQGASTLCYCNFWIGTENFWEEYVGKILVPIATFLEMNKSSDAARGALEPTTHSDHAPFLPFIAERLFSTFLSLNPNLKTAAYDFETDQVLNYCVSDFERDIVNYMRPSIDMLDQSNEFSLKDIRLMDLLCGLSQKYVRAYFAINPHPHTGNPINFDNT